MPQDDLNVTLMPQDDLNVTLVPQDDLNVTLMPQDDLNVTLMPQDDLNVTLMPSIPPGGDAPSPVRRSAHSNPSSYVHGRTGMSASTLTIPRPIPATLSHVKHGGLKRAGSSS